MAKYIGTYATSGDVQTAINNNELNRPFVAYTTSDGKVYYGADMTLAQVGDIVVYSTSDQLLHFIPQANYNTTTYPTASFVPVGVVAAPQTAPLSGDVSDVVFMGINWLDKNNPDAGNVNEQDIEWGYAGFDIPELINYETSGTVITDMNGKTNTAAVLQYATGQTDWRTASVITFTYDAGYYPLFECAWRYHTSGTVQGDWYVPACGQLEYIRDTESLVKLNAGFTAIGTGSFVFQNTSRGTSNEFSGTRAWLWDGNGWNNENGKNFGPGYRTRPFCQMPMTAI